jgi:hypothetical protein
MGGLTWCVCVTFFVTYFGEMCERIPVYRAKTMAEMSEIKI